MAKANKKANAVDEAQQPAPEAAATFTPLEVPDVSELPDAERVAQTRFAPLGSRNPKPKAGE